MHVHGAGDRLRDLLESPVASPRRPRGSERLGRVDEVGIDLPQLGLAETEVVERTGPLAADQDVRVGQQVDEALLTVGTLDVEQVGFLAPINRAVSMNFRNFSPARNGLRRSSTSPLVTPGCAPIWSTRPGCAP